MSQWHPAIQSSETQGSSRVCVLPDGTRIQEEIRAHDDAARSYTYVITESPLPVKDYAATLKVVELDGGRSRLEWSCSYEPLAPAEEVEAMITGVYDAASAPWPARSPDSRRTRRLPGARSSQGSDHGSMPQDPGEGSPTEEAVPTARGLAGVETAPRCRRSRRVSS
jgi:hypothetical protein